MIRRPPRSTRTDTLFPYTTLFRSRGRGVTLPTPTYAVFEGDTLDTLQEQVDALTPGLDFLVVDTPGRDDEFAKYMAARANTLVTPRSDKRGVGKGCGSTCRTRCWTYHEKQKKPKQLQ